MVSYMRKSSAWDKEEARDDVPGGYRATAIADLALTLTIKWKLRLGLRVCLFKIVHRGRETDLANNNAPLFFVNAESKEDQTA